jgi:diaminopimelate epimerase
MTLSLRNLPFVKYHGLGNDFAVVDLRAEESDLDAFQVRALCDRHRGLGADGVLSILKSSRAPAAMVVHNADGSIAEMCGNGLRCVVKHLAELQPEAVNNLTVETGAGVLRSTLEWKAQRVDKVTVSMGPARFEAAHLPHGGAFVNQLIDGHRATAVSMGNPHLVLLDAPLQDAPRIGPELERHMLFRDRTNVEFVEQTGPQSLRVVVWERGVGLTQACGTGACAAVAAWLKEKRVPADTFIDVELPGGVLNICVASDFSSVLLRGPVTRVFDGVVSL